MPVLPDPHALAVMALVVLALVLFTREQIPLETSCLAVMVILVLGFEIFPYQSGGQALRAVQFFSGFGHEALVAICALMVLGAGLETTGALRPVAALLARLWQSYPVLSLLLTLVVAAILSAFLNNTPIVVMLLPILVGTALRTGVSPSGLLLPMGFATLIGGMATTIGTSTNLLVVSVANDLGLKPFGLFSFTWMVAVASVPGLLYLWLVAPRLLPERKAPLEDTAPRVFEAWLHIGEDSKANGKTVAEIRKLAGGKLRLEALERGEGLRVSRLPSAVIRDGDRMRVSGTPEELMEYEALLGATLHNIDDLEHRVDEEHPLNAEGQQIAEVVVTEQSLLNHRTLSQVRFSERYNVVILGMNRPQGRAAASEISEEVLRNGDVLLVQGTAERIAELKGGAQLLVLDASMDLPKTQRAGVALLIMGLVVVFAATGTLPISFAALAGMLAMLALRCLTWEQAAAALSTQVIMIVAASLALGLALERTGGAQYLAQLYVALAAGFPPLAVLSGLMLLMAVLTNIVSNNAAAVIGTPIAVNIAAQLGVPPEPFVLAVLFGANMSYATPMGYQTNLLIMSAGGYRFSDFVRVGIPLTLIMWGALTAMLAVTYKL